MTHNPEIRNQLFDQFARSVLDSGWRRISCSDIASDAGVDLRTAFRAYRNRYSYVTELIRRTDAAMLDAYDKEMIEEPARERLLDVMMARFEAMQDNRDLIIALTKAARFDPMLSLHLLALSRLTADWFLDIARISPAGIGGIVRSKGALATYARAFRVWLDDDSEDLTKTMTALDKYLKRGESALRQAEKIACMLPRARGKCRSSKAEREEETETMPSDPGPSVTETGSVDDTPAIPTVS